MVNHYSRSIQNEILKRIFTASSSIRIAVAWFTNDVLFQTLLLKLKLGVNVELILNHDDINLNSALDFEDIARYGGTLRWNETEQLLHDKFCIIDNRIVITGSYNWTNKAEYNEESISVFEDEPNTIEFYTSKFKELSCRYVKVFVTDPYVAPKIEKIHLEDEPSVKDKPSKPKPEKETVKEREILHSGSCGEGVSFILYKDGELEIDGRMDGKMDSYERRQRPWEIYLGSIRKVSCYVDVGAYAFKGCRVLEEVFVDCSVIGESAFEDCVNLKILGVWKPLDSIELSAFKHCENLSTVKVAWDDLLRVRYIGKSAFYGCRSLSGITTPKEDWNSRYQRPSYEKNSIYLAGVETIDNFAFSGCTSLKTIHFPTTLKSVGKSAFNGCDSLEEVLLNPCLEQIDTDNFKKCKPRIIAPSFFEGAILESWNYQSLELYESETPAEREFRLSMPGPALWGEGYPKLPGYWINRPVTFKGDISMSEIKPGGSFLIYPGDIISFDEAPIVVLQRKKDVDKYFLTCRRNGNLSYVSLSAFVRRDYFGEPVGPFEKQALNWTSMRYFVQRMLAGRSVTAYETECVMKDLNGMPQKRTINAIKYCNQ